MQVYRNGVLRLDAIDGSAMQCSSGQDGLEEAMAKTADVVIIGAGVMGASIAFNLARRGISNVAVLTKSFIASGATGKISACVR